MNPVDEQWMQYALEQAKLAALREEVPVGAALICNGNLIAACGNAREAAQDPTAHAEVLVLRQAAVQLKSWRLNEAVLYVTQEPCLMCAGAIINARIHKLVYGCHNPKAGSVKTLYQVLEDSRLNHRVIVVSGVLAEDCATLLRQFFEKLRGFGKK